MKINIIEFIHLNIISFLIVLEDIFRKTDHYDSSLATTIEQ